MPYPSSTLYPGPDTYPGFGQEPVGLRTGSPYPNPEQYPSDVLYPGRVDLSQPARLTIRERAPTRLTVEIATKSGQSFRWAGDERDPTNVPSEIAFSATMPGGFEQFTCTLARKPAVDYQDLQEFSTVTARGAGGQVAWQGRLETTPRESGDTLSIKPGAVGFQAALQDDESVRQIYVDLAFGNWSAPTVARKIQFLEAHSTDIEDASTGPDPSYHPSVITQIAGSWSREHHSEAWYDAKGLAISRLYYSWRLQAAGRIGDQAVALPWDWEARLSTDDLDTVVDTSGNLIGSGNTGTVFASGKRTWASVVLTYTGSGGSQGVNYPVFWDVLAVYGDHGLPLKGTADATTAQGLLASDVIAHAISKFVPEVGYTTGEDGSIQPSAFIIPQLTFPDATTVADIIAQATKYELLDWAVWEGPLFHLNARAATGRRWQARVSQAGLQETGPQVDRIWNSVLVSYTDPGGATQTVGPPGSGATVEDSGLVDADPQNPATVAGITRRAKLDMGKTSTAPTAIQVGKIFLAEQRVVSTSGQATLVGHVMDDRGVMWPAWRVRPGDLIRFVDASDPGWRRIVRASYDDSTRSSQIDLDSPPDGLQALLERLGATLTRLGF